MGNFSLVIIVRILNSRKIRSKIQIGEGIGDITNFFDRSIILMKILLSFLPCSVQADMFLGQPIMGNLSHLHARYLSLKTGRFLTQDPQKQFFSQYVYGNGQVILSSDPSGEMEEENTLRRFFRKGKAEKEYPRSKISSENLTRVRASNTPDKVKINKNSIQPVLPPRPAGVESPGYWFKSTQRRQTEIDAYHRKQGEEREKKRRQEIKPAPRTRKVDALPNSLGDSFSSSVVRNESGSNPFDGSDENENIPTKGSNPFDSSDEDEDIPTKGSNPFDSSDEDEDIPTKGSNPFDSSDEDEDIPTKRRTTSDDFYFDLK
ncbi:hypothetical protein [Bathymodiolus japonicus methanotrophic gill symbiont]|uniref:hypothetical protein n=1 Tax=Bathymodiolus japonicus methanotrophic gill symbiont TaxID=113269 RepID=UPI001C8D0C12|nr:hypothetical protein [Bathymodiolus japonicus methanotrophic gill symbiont]